jgi:dTDP-4-dehydrorhamnose 3,5-epimerase
VKFEELSIPGAFVLEPERLEDERGFFARTWSREELAGRGLSAELVQCGIAYNVRKGTVRGMHFQAAPHAEVKLVRCTMGVIYDVIVDLRPDSPSYRKWAAVELTAENRRMLYIPVGLAHGYQTLADDTEVLYQMSEYYHPESARGVRWDDPAFGVRWPMREGITICERDATYPLVQS